MKAKNLTLLKVPIWGACILCSFKLLHAEGVPIYTPPGSNAVEGNTQVSVEEYGVRFQQVFDSSLFKPTMPNGGWIQIAYLRGDGPSFQPNFGNLSGAEVTLSTTTKEVNSLSPVFADNVGSDVKVLLSRLQTIDFTASSINDRGVRSYGPILYYAPSSRPPESWMFFYDPSKGNLLMDFKHVIATTSGGNVSDLTLDGTISPTMSSVYNDFRNGQDPATGTLSPKGLVMLFLVKPVPEPSVYALCGVGILGLGVFRRHRTNQQERSTRSV